MDMECSYGKEVEDMKEIGRKGSSMGKECIQIPKDNLLWESGSKGGKVKICVINQQSCQWCEKKKVAILIFAFLKL